MIHFLARTKQPKLFIALILLIWSYQGVGQSIFLPTEESLSGRTTPAWYDEAKLGIFIHWGLYSVPAWATPTTTPDKVVDWKEFYKNNPYAEWYLNSLRIEGSPTQTFHAKTYGKDHDYYEFSKNFAEQNKNWNAREWVALFKEIGAKYIVLTTKHSDGYVLYPSRIPHPFLDDSTIKSRRDLVGELAKAAREQQVKFGVYYCSGLDWSFYQSPVTNLWPDLFRSMPGSIAYTAYVDNHYYELIHRYKPDVLWNDVNFPKLGDWFGIMAESINHNSDVVFNNRWNNSVEENKIATLTHFDTPEYEVNDSISTRKWETCRDIGYSFGYNQNETDEHLLSADALIDLFIDIVSKNGNLLLNVGPRADGTIPENQMLRLKELGSWMKIYGEAIYGTTAWSVASAVLADGTRVRFTKKGTTIYMFLLDRPKGKTIVLSDIKLEKNSKLVLLGKKLKPLPSRKTNAGTEIEVGPIEENYAAVIRIDTAP